jgi:hypothetical protein
MVLRALKTDYLDLCQIHDPDYLPRMGDSEGFYDALTDAKKVKVALLYGTTTIAQTLNLQTVEGNAADYGLRTEKLKLLTGDYEVLTFTLYDVNDAEIYSGAPASDRKVEVILLRLLHEDLQGEHPLEIHGEILHGDVLRMQDREGNHTAVEHKAAAAAVHGEMPHSLQKKGDAIQPVDIVVRHVHHALGGAVGIKIVSSFFKPNSVLAVLSAIAKGEKEIFGVVVGAAKLLVGYHICTFLLYLRLGT